MSRYIGAVLVCLVLAASPAYAENASPRQFGVITLILELLGFDDSTEVAKIMESTESERNSKGPGAEPGKPSSQMTTGSNPITDDDPNMGPHPEPNG